MKQQVIVIVLLALLVFALAERKSPCRRLCKVAASDDEERTRACLKECFRASNKFKKPKKESSVATTLSESEFSSGATVCVKSGINMRSSACGDKAGTTSGEVRGRVLATTQRSCLGGNYQWVNIQLSGGNSVWVANVNGNSVYSCGASSTPAPVAGGSVNGVPRAPAGNPGFVYEYATQNSNGPSVGARSFQKVLQAICPSGRSGGIYNYRPVRGGSSLSLHAEGRAVDWMLNANNAAHAAEAQKFVSWMLANGAQKAKEYGVQEIIWNRQIWSSGRSSQGMRAYSGTNPHTDHIHVGLNRWGSRQTY